MTSTIHRCLLAASLTTGVMFAAASASAQPLPARVHAEYEITFNGLKVGGFEFTGENTAQSYKMSGSGKVSVLFGAFKWNGSSSASGAIASNGVVPSDYKFDLKGTTKGGSTHMTFADGAMAKVDMTPPPKVKADMIPVQPQHLKGVFDPMSAVMMMTRGGSDPCNRVVPVFEGQRRLEVLLSAQGTKPIETAEGGGKATATGIVCKVNYKLVSGHRPGDETAYMNKNQHIEMVLRPVPSANIYVPYEISASTLLGTIRVHSKRVSITPADQSKQQIVLLYDK